MLEPTRPCTPPRSRRRMARRSIVALALLFALAACGGGAPVDGGFGAGDVAEGAGASLYAPEGAFEGRVDLSIAATSDPSGGVPLPDGLASLGGAVRLSAVPTLRTGPAQPLVLTLPVPAGEDPDGLAIAILEDDVAYAAPPEDGPLPGPSWVVLQTFYDPADDRLVATALVVPEQGWTAIVVRVDGGDTPTVSAAASGPEAVRPAQTTPGFGGVCGPGYGSAVETCGQADLDALAAELEDAYDALTALGFTDDPHLERDVVVRSFGGFVYVIEPGDYRIEMRPASTAIAGGMFSSGSGRVWVAVGTGGVDAGDRETVRHEYVHATQYGYGLSFADGEWLASRWSIEGQAVLLQTDYATLVRDGRPPRTVETTLERSRWTGSAWGAAPSDEYLAQDFWMYLAQRFGHTDASFLEPFMAEGQRAFEIDATLRDEYPAEFGGTSALAGLSAAYWGWVRNQVYEKQYNPDPGRFGDSCAFLGASATPTLVNLTNGGTDQNGTLGPLTSQVYRLDAPSSAGGYTQALALSASASPVRAALYVDGGAGGSACFDTDARRDWAWSVPASGGRAYLVVANTSRTQTYDHTLSFGELEIVAPNGPVAEGSIGFRATGADLGDDVTVQWTYEPVGGGVPFFFGPSALGATVQQTVCDGTYVVTATARRGTTALAGASTTLEVTDTGATSASGPCAPTVSITAPEAGSTRAAGDPVGLRADVATGGATTYPVVWRNAATNAIVATGADTNASFAAGPVTLEVTYGAASATVSFTAVAQDPPTATITSPADGAFFAWYDDDAGITSYPVDVVGAGEAGDGGALPGSALQWSYRRAGTATWTSAGTGTSTTIDFPYGGSAVNQQWEIRLIASEGSLESEPALITITVQRPPD